MIIWWKILIAFYVITHMFAFITWIDNSVVKESNVWPVLLPKTIYNNFNVNWFGAIFLYVIYLITTPIFTVSTFIYQLCIVGKK